MSRREVRVASAAIQQSLLTLLPPAGNVAMYAHANGEVDVEPLYALLPRARFAFPISHAEDRRLEFRLLEQPPNSVRAFNIRAPDDDEGLSIEPHRLDAVIVPGTGFGENGERLGYGGGYYDRFLPLLDAEALRIGVCYEWQIRDKIPIDTHDVAMTHVVTEERIIVVPRGD